MTKALLLAMPEVVSGFDLISRLPNLGLVSIAGNVDKNLCEVKVADLILVKNNIGKTVIDLLNHFKPDIVGLSCMSFQYNSALKLAKLVKTYDKEMKLVMGGYHPTLLYSEISKSDDARNFDFIIRGEGESTFNDLILAINGKKNFQEIDGLSYKTSGGFKHNKPRQIMNLDSILLPERKSRIFTKGFHTFGIPSDSIESSRGCTMNCNFCCITHMYGKSFRKYKIERIIEDIENAKKNGAKSLAFVDDNIMLDVKWMRTLCDSIIDYRLDDLHYQMQASVAGIAYDKELIEKMAKAGFNFIFLGIENTQKKDLDFLGKKTKIISQGKAMNYLRKSKIIVGGGFILGNPDDKEEDFWYNFQQAKQLKVDIPIFFTATPYPKSKLREEFKAKGLITNPDDYSKYSCFSANIKTENLSSEQIEFLIWKMYQSWFSEKSWFFWNNIWSHYPLHLMKIIFTLYPRYLYGKLLLFLKLRNEKELYKNDMSNQYNIINLKKKKI